ncbi:MAG: tetratricopeptide repeat protein, partial [Magnetococcales bacterium]|nr:tetratricopeptide repeat protein [Magnetococcales bacterium]
FAVFLTDIRKDYDEAEKLFRSAINDNTNDSGHLVNFAVFLTDIRKDYDEAEKLYRRAIEADPNAAIHLGNFANFMLQVRKNHDKAEKLYRRAIEADPNNANILGNFAGMQLGRGLVEHGLALLQQAMALQPSEDDLMAEINFYALAHWPAQWTTALSEMRGLIGRGVRSPWWDLSANCRQARLDGHAQPEFLETLALVIADQAPESALQPFPCWHPDAP